MANTPRLRRSAIVALTLGFGVLGGAAAGIAEASSGDHRDPRPGPSGTFVRPSNGPGGPGGVPTARPDRPADLPAVRSAPRARRGLLAKFPIVRK